MLRCIRISVLAVVVTWAALLMLTRTGDGPPAMANPPRRPTRAPATDAPMRDDPHHGGDHEDASPAAARDAAGGAVVVTASRAGTSGGEGAATGDEDSVAAAALPDMTKRVYPRESAVTSFDRKPHDASQQEPIAIPRRWTPDCLGAPPDDGSAGSGAAAAATNVGGGTAGSDHKPAGDGSGPDGGDGQHASSAGRRCERYRNPYPALATTARPCRNLAYTRGAWVHNASIVPPYPAYGEVMGSCQRDWLAEGHSERDVRPELQYEWVPSECELLPWSVEGFCRALRGRDLMLAGDSLNDHWHATLAYLLGVRGDIYKREGTVAGKHSCKGHPICHRFYKKPLKLFFLTNQLLEKRSMRNRNHKWWKFVRPYPVLVLNSGSWMRDPTNEEREVSDDEWRRLMQGALELVQNQRYNGTIVWRTTYQGHPHCWQYDKPLTAELTAADFPTVVPYKRYRWAAIPGRNRFSTALWTAAGAHVLDVTRLTNLMPLGHLGKHHPKFRLKNTTDCLHYCAPTPVYDTWSRLLLNLLAGNL